MKTLYLYKKIFSLISSTRRKKLVYSIILGVINSLLDVLALSSIFPAVYIATHNSIIHQNNLLSTIYTTLNFTDDNFFILFILVCVLLLFLFRMIVSLLIFNFQNKATFETSEEFTYIMSNAFFLKNILDVKKTTIGELDKEIRFLPLQMANFVLIPMSILVSELVVISIILLGIINFNFQLFLMLLITIFPLVAIFYYIIRKKIRHLGIALNNASTKNFNNAREMITGYADIKMQNKTDYFINRLLQSVHQHNNIQIKINIYQQIVPKLLEWSALLSAVLIYIYAISFKESKSEIIVILAVYLAAAYRLLPSLNRINSSLLLIRQYEFIIDILQKSKKQLIHQKEKTWLPDSKKTLPFNHNIVLKDIALSYSNNKKNLVLKNITLTIHKGEILGIVGKSGSGKTSLVYILSGLLPPTHGHILVDNQIIDTHNISEWQKQIAFVYQDIFLINGSVLDNIAFGEDEKNIDVQRVWNCLSAVQLDEYVKSLPQNIHTPIGEGGGFLSGGQKQRLVIARALYRNASLFIMDEATSALDEKTQESVIQTIHRIAKSCHITIILIAHRITSLKYCDRIIYLENGTITKEISYQDLMSENQ